MELFNILATDLPVYGETFEVSLNWIGKLIRLLCDGIGSVGVGIIIFSLILKLITLPFDIFQRISMRKQNIQMKANQEKMDKLQKQYANDKETYNKKLMEMYKENGISMFSSCLPMILSLVIFIVAINAFNAYAQYANVENYNTLVDAYNANLKQHCVVLTEEKYSEYVDEENFRLSEDGLTAIYTVKSDEKGKFAFYTFSANQEEFQALDSVEKKVEYIEKAKKTYYFDEERAVLENEDVAAATAAGMNVREYLSSSAKNAVVVAYNEQVKGKTSFGWMKNIWVTDATYKHPVLTASEFSAEAQREKFDVYGKKVSYGDIHQYTDIYGEEFYNSITENLTDEKEQPNGYFILIALSIGTILLQQFVSMRSQKEQQKYSSVDGTAGSQQKMTMIIMTGMFAIFSFMYSAAFSIYLITSNLFSLLSTVVINKLVDINVDKKEAEKSVKKMKNDANDRIEKARNAGKQSAEESKKKNKS